MPAYHKQVKQSIATRHELPVENLTLADLRDAVKGRFNSFCMAVGLEALMALMEQDVEAVAGPKGKHDAKRRAYRHGTQPTSIPMGSQRIAIDRPRVRSTDTRQELPIPSYEAFANDDQLLEAALGRMLYGLSTRDYGHTIDDYGDVGEALGTSKSAISQRFIKASSKEAKKVLGRRFDELAIPVFMIDGIVLGDYTAIVVLGITADGKKLIMGVRVGSTENAEVCHDLLTDLIERGLCYERGLLAVIDGSKALRKALKDVFGQHVLIQRCQVHKTRNVLAYLPKHKRDWVKRNLQRAWAAETAEEATRQLHSLATGLNNDYPDAAASLREGLEETVTISRLDIPGLLRKSLRSTNSIESTFSMVAKNIRNVKNWQNGSMVQRWVSAALLDAESRTRRIKGHRFLPMLAAELKKMTSREAGDTENESNIA